MIMEENNNQKLDFIDALRGIAIFGVIAVHCTCTGLPSYIRLITEQGARGVQLFFLVSALTLFFSLSKREHKEKHLNINFFIRRFFRIAPMYYISLLIYLGLYWLEGTSHISKANILSHFLFLNGFNPYHINSILSVEWSVAVEMTFYVLVPILFKCIKTTTSSITAAFITLNIYVIISIVTNHIIPIKNKELWMSYKGIWFVSQAPVFMLGIILYFILFK
jgi:peptidoglycan/LPS O-acetylase OafA/YrhL